MDNDRHYLNHLEYKNTNTIFIVLSLLAINFQQCLTSVYVYYDKDVSYVIYCNAWDSSICIVDLWPLRPYNHTHLHE